jgi:hypothetical protein
MERPEDMVEKRNIKLFVVLLAGAVCKGVSRDVKQPHKRRAIVYEYERMGTDEEQKLRNLLVGF